MTPPTTNQEYAEQIRRCAQALAIAKNDQVTGDLANGHTMEMLKMFTDGNLDKRCQKLIDECEIMADEFEDLEDFENVEDIEDDKIVETSKAQE